MSHRRQHFIPRTPSEIWGIVTDWKVAEYWLGVSRLRPTEGQRTLRAGSVLAYDVRGMLHPMTVTAWEPPHHLGLSTEQGGITAHYDFQFAAEGDGTRVTRTAGCTGRSFGWRIAARLLEWLMRFTDRKQLVALEGLVRITTGSGR
jgi:Polyketide cyclase / dehydrase and lipid transport